MGGGLKTGGREGDEVVHYRDGIPLLQEVVNYSSDTGGRRRARGENVRCRQEALAISAHRQIKDFQLIWAHEQSSWFREDVR